MNNAAALAMLMPLDLQAADKAERSCSLTLVPWSFASILGGMITLIGWRLLPCARKDAGPGREMFDLADYIAALKVPDDSPVIGKRVRDLDELAEKSDVEMIGLIRKGQRMPGLARVAKVMAGDILVVEANPESIDEALGAMQLEYVGTGEGQLKDDDLTLTEVAIPESTSQSNTTNISK